MKIVLEVGEMAFNDFAAVALDNGISPQKMIRNFIKETASARQGNKIDKPAEEKYNDNRSNRK